MIAWNSFLNFADAMKMFAWLQKLEHPAAIYDHQANELIQNDLNSFDYLELQSHATHLMLDGSIH